MDFWDTRDNYAIREFYLPRLYREISGQPDAVFLHVCLNAGEDPEKWEFIVRSLGMKGYHYLATEELTRIIMDSEDEEEGFSYPWSMITDREGRVVVRFAAPPSKPEKVMEQLQFVLEEY